MPESLGPNIVPKFRERLGEVQALFEHILEQTVGVSQPRELKPTIQYACQRYGIDGSSISCHVLPALPSVATICTGTRPGLPQRPFGELPDR